MSLAVTAAIARPAWWLAVEVLAVHAKRRKSCGWMMRKVLARTARVG